MGSLAVSFASSWGRALHFAQSPSFDHFAERDTWQNLAVSYSLAFAEGVRRCGGVEAWQGLLHRRSSRRHVQHTASDL
jgi:hypothetical protein